jgi:hypothetical protein
MTSDWLLLQEEKLLRKYTCSTIGEVLQKQQEIIGCAGDS